MVSSPTVTGRGGTRACGDGAGEPEGRAECGPRLVLSRNEKTRGTVIKYKTGKEAGRGGGWDLHSTLSGSPGSSGDPWLKGEMLRSTDLVLGLGCYTGLPSMSRASLQPQGLEHASVQEYWGKMQAL